jgi:hypothetical protein
MKRKDPGAVRLGHLGGLASAKALTRAKRVERAKKAIRARWRKAKAEKAR